MKTLPIDIYLAIYLILIGFVVGILSGFFGFGGGFIITPLLFTLGLQMNTAVGTSIAQILGTSVIATMRHRKLRNVDIKGGIIIAAGSVIGVESGVWMVEYFKGIGTETLNISISLAYIFVLSLVSIIMVRESLRSRQIANPPSERRIVDRVRSFRAPPIVSLSHSNGTSISFWILLFVGFITGTLGSFLGAGGGFVQVPLLIHLVGLKTVVAVGTSVFVILISTIFACFSHAVEGNVDILWATIMLVGSSVGVQIGVSAIRYVRGANLRLVFGFCVASVSLSVAFELMARLLGIYILSFFSQTLLVLTVVSVAFFVIVSTFLAVRRNSES